VSADLAFPFVPPRLMPRPRTRYTREESAEIARSRQMQIALYAVRVRELAARAGAPTVSGCDRRVTLAVPGATIFGEDANV